MLAGTGRWRAKSAPGDPRAYVFAIIGAETKVQAQHAM